MTFINPNTCKVCKHSWRPIITELYCRRYPPTVGWVPGPNGQPAPMSTFAPIQDEFTCGEFRPKIEVAQ